MTMLESNFADGVEGVNKMFAATASPSSEAPTLPPDALIVNDDLVEQSIAVRRRETVSREMDRLRAGRAENGQGSIETAVAIVESPTRVEEVEVENDGGEGESAAVERRENEYDETVGGTDFMAGETLIPETRIRTRRAGDIRTRRRIVASVPTTVTDTGATTLTANGPVGRTGRGNTGRTFVYRVVAGTHVSDGTVYARRTFRAYLVTFAEGARITDGRICTRREFAFAVATRFGTAAARIAGE